VENVFSQTKEFLGYHEQVLSACARELNVRIPMVVVRGRAGSILASAPSWRIVGKYRLPDGATVISYRALGFRWLMTDIDNFLQAVFADKKAA
jgi:hypothetical protein